MRVAIAHNFYQRPGGEDNVFHAEGALLEAKGHSVFRFIKHNDDVDRIGKLELARNAVWNPSVFREAQAFIREHRIDVVHVHNTLPLISPSIYDAAWVERVPVVQTLHNYRTSCINGYLYRDGTVCEDCLGETVPWRGVVRRCYRDSAPASAVVASVLGFHKARGTYRNRVERYIAPTAFARSKHVEAGLPAEKIVVKPHFLDPDPGAGDGQGGYALFVGRLSPEKGISTLLDAWKRIGRSLPLKIVGDGPLANEVRAAEATTEGIEWVGWKSRSDVVALMRAATILVCPSVWYEGALPLTIVEAFATGLPVVTSNFGTMASLVEHGHTGWLFDVGDGGALARQILRLLEHPAELNALRDQVRREYEARYTAERNYEQLLRIYDEAIESRRRRLA